MAGRRYIVKSALLTRTVGGEAAMELWIGFEIDGPIDLAFLSRHGYDFIPADGMSEEELLSVGVTTFELVEVPIRAED